MAQKQLGAAPSNPADAVTKSYVGQALEAVVPTSRTINQKALTSNIVLTQDDIGSGTTNVVYTATEKARLADTSGTNTGDQTSVTGNAGTATRLQTARTLQANLESNSATSFDGTVNITLGVAGTLPVANGGTGAATLTGILKGSGTSAFSAAVAGTDYLAPGGPLGTPNSGTLTNCTGLPVSGIAASTISPVGVGSIELGHASDTTLTRSAAGVLAVEGIDLVRRQIQIITSSTTLGSSGDYIVFVRASGAPILPTAVANTGVYWITNEDTSDKTISTTGGQTINGQATLVLPPDDSIVLVSNGTNWRIF